MKIKRGDIFEDGKGNYLKFVRYYPNEKHEIMYVMKNISTNKFMTLKADDVDKMEKV